MRVRNETETGFSAEIKIVPLWAWALASVGFVSAQLFFNTLFTGPDAPAAWLRALMGVAAGFIFGCYVLLVGYVNRDAPRRGMSAILWTLVTIVIPNGLGIILYFILRHPLRRACSQCGNTVQPGFNFCPRCSARLSASCPQCHRVVGVNDAYCPYCATSLRNQEAPGYATRL